jgi:2-C-methyl-D-erythritol 4-phosphate cytidylyltransferase
MREHRNARPTGKRDLENLAPEPLPVNAALIVAAGKGTRMGPGADKLFLVVAGKPLIVQTWQRFDTAECIDEIVLVVREGMQGEFELFARQFGIRKPFRTVFGGKERQDSVWNGLQALPKECEVVAIQDGARPCTEADLIANTIKVARESGAAVAAQRVTDTIKQSKDGRTISGHLERSSLWAVQTPQTFRLEVIRRALMAVRQAGSIVTDDTAACEFIGQAVNLVESLAPNPKVTSPSDLPYIHLLLSGQNRPS